MEDNKYFYESEYKSLSNTTAALRRQLEEKSEELRRQELLLEELYKLVYYKRAWLTLSDDNIRGMQKVVGKLPLNEEEESAYPNIMPKTSDEYDDNDPWGV
jgi:hypothetical protein